MRLSSIFGSLAFAVLAAGCSENKLPVAPAAPAVPTPVTSGTNSDWRFEMMRAPQGKRGNVAASSSALLSGSGALTFHSGSVMLSHVTYAIFNGPSWQGNTTFTRDKITSVESFLGGFGNSNLANILTEYTDGSGNHISAGSTYMGKIVDNGTALSGNSTNQTVGNYVCGQLAAHGITARSDAVYLVFTEDHYASQAFVAWHNYWDFGNTSSCNGQIIRFAFMLNTDGMVTGLDGVYHSDDAAYLVNAASHELFETITDPIVGSGWFASNGDEVADKCNFGFNGFETLSNGDHFQVQTEWSNFAFNQGAGLYAEAGCVNIRPVNLSGPTSTSSGVSYTWNTSSPGGAGVYTYQWTVDYDDGSHWVGGASSSQSFTPNWPDGNFTIHVTASAGGFSLTTSQRVTCANNWQNNVAYAEDAYVCYGSEVFKSTLDANIGNTPYSGSPYWATVP